jgi:hypothetical protein
VYVVVVAPLEVPEAAPELLQLVAPAVPLTVKVITPFGATAFALPVATAVKVMDPPSDGVPDVVSCRVAVALPTAVEVEEVTTLTAL